MSDSSSSKPSLLKGRWLWATLLVLAGTALLIRLGFWQLQRLQERRVANALLVGRLNQPALALDGSPMDAAAADLRRATTRGMYDFGQEIILRNRALNGAAGVHLITPLQISGSAKAILVDRGWIPFERTLSGDRSEFDKPAGEVEAAGLLHRSQPRSSPLSPADPPLTADRPRLDQWFRVDIPRIQQQIPYPLLPVYLELGEPNLDATAMPPAASAGLPRPDIEIDLSEGPHLSYAIQWFSFAFILCAGYVYLFLRRTTHEGPDTP